MKKTITFLLLTISAYIGIAQTQATQPLQQSSAPQIAPLQQMQIPQGMIPANAQQMQSQPTPPPPDPEKFASLFPKIEGDTSKIGLSFWEAHWHCVLIFTIVAIAIIALLLRKKRIAPIPPMERALQRIALARRDSEKLSEKLYALVISQAVRDYIEDKHSLPAPERTTKEFLQMASSADIFDDNAQELLRKILTLSDMAKFAQHSFQNQERDELALLSIEFIESDDIKEDKKSPANATDKTETSTNEKGEESK